jgi:hypothetical protein
MSLEIDHYLSARKNFGGGCGGLFQSTIKIILGKRKISLKIISHDS